MNAETFLSALAGDPISRLRWRVLSRFGIPPGCADDRGISDRDCLLAAAHMVLDLRQGERKGAGGNPAFDEARFEALKEGGF